MLITVGHAYSCATCTLARLAAKLLMRGSTSLTHESISICRDIVNIVTKYLKKSYHVPV